MATELVQSVTDMFDCPMEAVAFMTQSFFGHCEIRPLILFQQEYLGAESTNCTDQCHKMEIQDSAGAPNSSTLP